MFKLLSSVLFFLVFASAAAASPFVVKAKTGEHPDTGVSLEVQTTAAESAEDAEAAVKWARKELARAQAENPALKAEIVVAASAEAAVQPAAHELAEMAQAVSPATRAEQVELPKEALEGARSKFKDWFFNHYRVSFTIIRGVANTGTVTWGLAISPDIPWEAALPVGLVAGGMSSGLMYFNDLYQRFVTRGGSEFAKWRRSYYVTLAYLGVTKVASAFAGIPQEATVVASLGSVITTAFTGTLAQGSWSLFIASGENEKLERLGLKIAKERGLYVNPKLVPRELHESLVKLAQEHAPLEVRAIKFKTSVKVLAVSMVATSITVAAMMGAPYMDMGIWGLTAGGGTLWIKSLFKARQWKKVRDAQIADCAAHLLPARAAL